MLNSAIKYMFIIIFGRIFVRYKIKKNSKYTFKIFTNETLFTYHINTNCPGKKLSVKIYCKWSMCKYYILPSYFFHFSNVLIERKLGTTGRIFLAMLFQWHGHSIYQGNLSNLCWTLDLLDIYIRLTLVSTFIG